MKRQYLANLVFYLSLLAGLGTLFVRLTTNLISAKLGNWIGVVAALLMFVAFEFYEQLNGTVPPPPAPAADPNAPAQQ